MANKKSKEQNTAYQPENRPDQLNKPESKFEEKQPGLSKSISLSKDGKWLIIKTIRTDIVHVNYMQKIMEGDKVDGNEQRRS